MKLLTPELQATIPKLYAQEGIRNPMVFLKFFLPGTNWTWYATEGEAQECDFLFFGYTFGLEGEWGYWLLSELEQVRNQFKQPVERDIYFIPAPWKEVEQRHLQEHGLT